MKSESGSRGVVASAIGLGFVGLVAYLTRRSWGGSNSEGGALAHRADGSDDSASFDAGIADEGTIPDVDPLATASPAA